MPPWARGECCRTLEIEAAVCLIVSDVRAGARQYSLAGCYGFEGCSRFRNMGRNAVDLLCIEDCVDLVDEPTLRLFCRSAGAWLGSTFSSDALFTSQNSIRVPLSPFLTCQSFSDACLYVIQ